jgi:protoheme IX farnesyltransferase
VTVGARARAYLQLTKPGITLFVVLTAGAGFITAEGGWGQPLRLVIALIATGLMSAGASTLNQVAESGGDARMRRTAGRPIPAGIISARRAAAFGWGLGVLGLSAALAWLPWLSAVVLVLCHVSYVNVYTPLKRRTPLCTLAGAIPGALPVLAGWTATGRPIGLAGLALTGVLFMWQIPHFLALGWLSREDYARAGCPMLGVGDPTGSTSARVALMYAVAMLVSATVVGMGASTGTLYMATAVLTGVAYTAFAWAFVRNPGRGPARRLFLGSLAVLPILLVALVADLIVR